MDVRVVPSRKLSTKNWCFWTVMLEKTLENPLDCKEIKPVHPKGNQSWIFTGGTDAEAEVPILWPPDAKSWLICKDPDVGKDWRQEEKGMNRGWDGWMASLTQWTWVWASSRSWWWTGKPGVLQSMRLQRVGKNTGVGSHSLLQGSNPGLWHCRQILYHLSHQGSSLSTWNKHKSYWDGLPWWSSG